jgi:GNAT superfamily N-acetyltransferase
MFVDRERRGTGVGGALIEAVATWAHLMVRALRST